MKKTVKVLFMAFVAMFAFNTVADAQIGGLLKKAKKAVGMQSSTEKAMEINEQSIKASEAIDKAGPKTPVAKPVQLKSWKTGEIETFDNKMFGTVNPYSAEEVLGWEQNFRNKEAKKQIIEYIMDEEKFNNKKLPATNMRKDRKLVSVIFRSSDWKLLYDNLGNIRCRRIWVASIYELTNGATMFESCEYDNSYTGGGNYSDTFSEVGGSFKMAYIKVWEHKDGADPLKDL